MLWDLIRDFFVQHIFGGVDSLGVRYSVSTGILNGYINGELDDTWEGTLNEIETLVSNGGGGYKYFLSISDYLSTTATIISITIIFVLCCVFVYKIIRLIGGLIR